MKNVKFNSQQYENYSTDTRLGWRELFGGSFRRPVPIHSDLRAVCRSGEGSAFFNVTTQEELMRDGERTWNLERLFSIREGVLEDIIAPRLFKEALDDGRQGGAAVSRERFLKARAMYYGARGWSEGGVPTPEKLEALGLPG